MMKSPLLIVCLLSAPLAFGQLDSNSIVVTASRTVNLQPDQAVYSVVVNSGTDATIGDILAALPGTGITAANLSSVNTFQGSPIYIPVPPAIGPLTPNVLAMIIEWRFSLAVPLAKMKDTVTMLTALQQSILQKNNGLSLSFSVQGLQASPQLQQSQTCAISDLLADARAKAQKLADAAGLGVGNILALSSATASAPTIGYSSFLFAPYYPSGCSLTVKFALGRF